MSNNIARQVPVSDAQRDDGGNGLGLDDVLAPLQDCLATLGSIRAESYSALFERCIHIESDDADLAQREMKAVVRDAERATHAILGEAEMLLSLEGLSAADYKSRVDDGLLRIIEACAFQDAIGQRLAKVHGLLNAPRPPEQNSSSNDDADSVRVVSLKLHGPAFEGPVTSQTAIDEMFSIQR